MRHVTTLTCWASSAGQTLLRATGLMLYAAAIDVVAARRPKSRTERPGFRPSATKRLTFHRRSDNISHSVCVCVRMCVCLCVCVGAGAGAVHDIAIRCARALAR